MSFDFAVDRYASKRVGTFFSFYGIFKLLWKCDKSDHRSYEHYLSSKNEAWKKIQAWTGVELTTSAIPEQANWELVIFFFG